jgi:hypothetical protein
MSERPEPKSLATESDDREDVVELWIAAQLLIERRFYRAVGKTSGPRMRLVTLVELDALTQLSDEGETLEDIATTLGVDLTVARTAVRNLVRRSLLLRERGSVWTKASQARCLSQTLSSSSSASPRPGS